MMLRHYHYGLILADPPWQFQLHSDKGEAKSPQAQYSCASLEDIARLPVAKLAAPDFALNAAAIPTGAGPEGGTTRALAFA